MQHIHDILASCTTLQNYKDFVFVQQRQRPFKMSFKPNIAVVSNKSWSYFYRCRTKDSSRTDATQFTILFVHLSVQIQILLLFVYTHYINIVVSYRKRL